jgi:hypothetical protein
MTPLREHFDHWDTTGFPSDGLFYCLVETPTESPIRYGLVTAKPMTIRSECGIDDHYWTVESEKTVIRHHGHRDLRETDPRIVAWLATIDPMLTPFELNEQLEKQALELRYLRSRVFQLEAELERDEDEIRRDERERLAARK